MSKHVAVLQNFNMELVKHIEHLNTQKEKLCESINKDEHEKDDILSEIAKLNERLEVINANLEEKKRMHNECEKTLSDAEMGLNKIIETSQTLLSLVQRESEVVKF